MGVSYTQLQKARIALISTQPIEDAFEVLGDYIHRGKSDRMSALITAHQAKSGKDGDWSNPSDPCRELVTICIADERFFQTKIIVDL